MRRRGRRDDGGQEVTKTKKVEEAVSNGHTVVALATSNASCFVYKLLDDPTAPPEELVQLRAGAYEDCWGLDINSDGTKLTAMTARSCHDFLTNGERYSAKGKRQIEGDAPKYTCAFTGTGDYLVVGTSKGAALCKPDGSGQVLHTFPIRHVRDVQVSPDDALVAVAGDRVCRVWDLESREVYATLTGHTRKVQAVAFSPDGSHIATASRDNMVHVWHLGTRERVAVLNGHTERVNTVAFSPSGDIIASGSHDGTVRIWRGPDFGDCAQTLSPNRSAVWAVAFHPNNNVLMAGGGRRVQIYAPNDSGDFAPVHTMQPTGHAIVNCIRFTRSCVLPPK
eukprot:m.127648 g.127648  ORF g.127648 m.127648 type:complete len:337 (+) comp16711_c1_seq3:70-1080(+)